MYWAPSLEAGYSTWARRTAGSSRATVKRMGVVCHIEMWVRERTGQEGSRAWPTPSWPGRLWDSGLGSFRCFAFSLVLWAQERRVMGLLGRPLLVGARVVCGGVLLEEGGGRAARVC